MRMHIGSSSCGLWLLKRPFTWLQRKVNKYGYAKSGKYYVIKIASGFHDNPKIGLPEGRGLKAVRYWDGAATKKTEGNDPDYNVGIRLEKDKNNILYVTDMVRIQQSPLSVQSAIKNTTSQDVASVRIGIEQNPGKPGVSEADYLVRMLQGYNVKTVKATQDKVTRALPASSQAEAGNIKILQAPWNEDCFRELENFPEGAHDDIVDALSGTFLLLNESSYDLAALITL